MKSPTILPLAEDGWSSLHTVIDEDKFWEVIDELKNGRRGRNFSSTHRQNCSVMKRYILPRRDQWSEICSRPAFEQGELTDRVSSILEKVKKVGDQALFNYTEELDGVRLQNLLVTKDELEAAADLVSDDLKNAIQSAKSNIEKFHSSQKDELKFVETTEGVLCWRKSVAIEKVGLYIPGGSAPLFSTILMLGIPATLAGCREVILCTPPDKDGKVNPAILIHGQSRWNFQN